MYKVQWLGNEAQQCRTKPVCSPFLTPMLFLSRTEPAAAAEFHSVIARFTKNSLLAVQGLFFNETTANSGESFRYKRFLFFRENSSPPPAFSLTAQLPYSLLHWDFSTTRLAKKPFPPPPGSKKPRSISISSPRFPYFARRKEKTRFRRAAN